MLLLWIALLGPSWAGDREITLNGVDIGTVRDQRFVNVTVWVDADGNVHLESERYKAQVEGEPQAAAETPPELPLDPVDTAVASTATTVDRPARITPRDPEAGESALASTTPAKPPPVSRVPPGSWWLATEDNASRGHEARVYINGTLVRTVRSGDAQVIDDISSYLRSGDNTVMIQTRSLNPGGGGFYVYVGAGSNQGGTVTLAQPDIQHGLGPGRNGDDVREYTLTVP